jgi:uncharacterized membrane protein
MQTPETSKSADEEPNTPRKFLTLLILGFSTMIVGLILVAFAAIVSQGSSASFGGIIFIGPFPIVFGAGPGAQWLILFALILAVLSIIMLLMLCRKPSNGQV